VTTPPTATLNTRTTKVRSSIEIEIGAVGVLIDPRPARRRRLGPVHRVEPCTDTGQLEIAGKGEVIRRINGDYRELLSMVVVRRRTRIEKLVTLLRDERTAGVENAAVGLTGNRRSRAKIVEGPQIRRVVVVEKGTMVDLVVRRIRCAGWAASWYLSRS